MKKLISNKYLLFLCRIIIGLIFIFAGAEKINDPLSFSDSILNYKLFPLVFANSIAIIIPWIEITTGLLLVLGISVKENAAIVCSFLLIFTILVAITAIRGLNIDCGCFGGDYSQKAGLSKIIENILLLILGINLLIFGSDVLSISRQTN